MVGVLLVRKGGQASEKAVCGTDKSYKCGLSNSENDHCFAGRGRSVCDIDA